MWPGRCRCLMTAGEVPVLRRVPGAGTSYRDWRVAVPGEPRGSYDHGSCQGVQLSSRTAVARSRITGDASADWPTCSGGPRWLNR